MSKPEFEAPDITVQTYETDIEKLMNDIAMRLSITETPTTSNKTSKAGFATTKPVNNATQKQIKELQAQVEALTKQLNEQAATAKAAAAVVAAAPPSAPPPPAAVAAATTATAEVRLTIEELQKIRGTLLGLGATPPPISINVNQTMPQSIPSSPINMKVFSELINVLREAKTKPTLKPEDTDKIIDASSIIEELRRRIEALEKAAEEAAKNPPLTEADKAKLESTIVELEKDKDALAQLQAAMTELEGRVTTAEGAIRALQAGLVEARADITRLDKISTDVVQSIERLGSLYETFEITFKLFETQFTDMTAQGAQTTTEQQTQFDELLRQTVTAKDAAQGAAAAATAQVAAAQAARNNTATEIARLEALIAANKEASEAGNAVLEGKKLDRREFEAFQTEYKQAIAELRAKDADLEAAILAANARNTQFSTQLAANTAKLNEIERVRTAAVPGLVKARVSQVQEGTLPSLLGLTLDELNDSIAEAKKQDLIKFLIDKNVIYQADKGFKKTLNGIDNFKKLITEATLVDGQTSYFKLIQNDDRNRNTTLDKLISRLNPSSLG
jgi:chromosome segregation ATPase